VAPTPSTEPEFSLEQLVELAQKNSPRGVIARESLSAARQRALASRAYLTPSLQMVPGITGSAMARDESVVVAQPLDLFGLRRARSAAANAEVKRFVAESDLVQRRLLFEVKTAAIALFAAQEAESLERVQVEIATLFRDAATRRAELGDVPPVQVQRAELELLRLQTDLGNAQTLRLTQRAVLNQLIGAEPSASLRVSLPLDADASSLLRFPVAAPSLPNAAVSTPSLSNPAFSAPAASTSALTVTGPVDSALVGGEFVTGDIGSRPDILSAQAGVALRQARARALRRETLPTVELQARRSAFFGRDGSVALRAVVTMPLFDFGALKGERRAVEAEARAQEAELTLLRQQAAAQVERARLRLKQNRENVARYREQLLPLTLDLLRKTQIGYAQGASTYLEVLEAQRTLRQIQSDYLRALVGVSTTETELDGALFGGLSNLENNDNRNEIATRGVVR
jgi:cobalt-zinc-cadmium efflux system outer membrane protein